MTEYLCIVWAKFFVFIFCAVIVIRVKETCYEPGVWGDEVTIRQ